MRIVEIIVVVAIGYAALRYHREHVSPKSTSETVESRSNPVYRSRSTEDIRAELSMKEDILAKFKGTHEVTVQQCRGRVASVPVTFSAETQQQMAQFEVDVRALRAELASR